MKNFAQKYYILIFFILLNGCLATEENRVEPVDEVGQLLSDIQDEETNSTFTEPNEGPTLELSDEKLEPSPTQEYDSVLLDKSVEEDSSKEPIEPPVVEITENQNIECNLQIM